MGYIYTNQGPVKVPERIYARPANTNPAVIAARRQLKTMGGDATARMVNVDVISSEHSISEYGLGVKALVPPPLQIPHDSNHTRTQRSLSKSRSSSPVTNMFKGVRRMATFGLGSKNGRRKTSSPTTTMLVSRGVQTDPWLSSKPTGSECNIGLSKPFEKAASTQSIKRKTRPNKLESFNSFIRSNSPQASVSEVETDQPSIESLRLDANQMTRSESTLRPPSLSLVGPNFAKDIAAANKSTNTVGTYGSHYSQSTDEKRTSFRRAISDTNIRRTPHTDVAQLAPELQEEPHPEADRQSERLKSSDDILTPLPEMQKEPQLESRRQSNRSTSSEEIFKRRGARKPFVPGFSLAIRDRRSATSSSYNSEPSPLRREMRADENSTPSTPSPPPPPIFHREVGDYFNYPKASEEKILDVPDHLRGSILCPLHPKCRGGQKVFCPIHGELSGGSKSSESSNRSDGLSKLPHDEAARRLLERMRQPEMADPDHAADSPLCPANDRALGTRATCAFHGGRPVVRGEDSEDSIPRVGINWR